jgi:hypothetical protein
MQVALATAALAAAVAPEAAAAVGGGGGGAGSIGMGSGPAAGARALVDVVAARGAGRGGGSSDRGAMLRRLQDAAVTSAMSRVVVHREGSTTAPLLNARDRAEKRDTAGLGWFDLPAPTVTPTLRRELELLRARGVLDPKRKYKVGRPGGCWMRVCGCGCGCG